MHCLTTVGQTMPHYTWQASSKGVRGDIGGPLGGVLTRFGHFVGASSTTGLYSAFGGIVEVDRALQHQIKALWARKLPLAPMVGVACSDSRGGAWQERYMLLRLG